MQPPHAQAIYQFGEFELDPLRRVLLSRADGRQVEITGRVIEALIHLVERAGQLVEKRALIEALWPHVVVEEGNLTQTIHTLRRVLGEKSGEHRYIATVPGRGYRFVAAVTVRGAPATVDPRSVDSPSLTSAAAEPPLATLPSAVPAPASSIPVEPAPPRRTKWMLAAAASAIALLIVIGALAWPRRDPPAAAPAVRAHPSIAVLPFVDMSADQDQIHFAEGLSEEILNILARADALRVIARTSSFSFRDQSVDIRTIAQRLSVTHVLEGSVRKSGERVRITAQLIDAATSAHVWSDTFDRDLHDIFGVQREIATAVADALHVTLRSAGPTRAETTSTQAYEHYLQGRHLFSRRSEGDLLQAKSHFAEAVRIDPDYGRAWSALAGVYFVARYSNIELPDALQNWGEATTRAVALSPDLAEAHVRAAQYQWHAGRPDLSEVNFARAVVLDPADPLVLGISIDEAMCEGRLSDAVSMQRRVVATDPLSANHRGNLGVLLMMVGLLPEARIEMERALELSPASLTTLENIADVLILQRRIDEAFKVVARLPPGYRREQRVALAKFARGDVSEGEASFAALIALAEKPDAGPVLAFAVAEVHAARGDPDLAFQWLGTARERSSSGPGALPHWMLRENLHVAPFLRPLHADPRWRALVDAVKKQAGSASMRD